MAERLEFPHPQQSMRTLKIALYRVALRFWPKRPGPADLMISLSYLLYARFLQLRRMTDLDEALGFQRTGCLLLPNGHPHRAVSHGMLALYLYIRFKELGTLFDLDESIRLQRDVLELYPAEHPFHPDLLSHLSTSLYFRFMQFGMLSDLDEALALERDALELRPQEDQQTAISLANIADILRARFNRLKRLPDLDSAIAFQRDAFKLCPEGHPDQILLLDNLSSFLGTRFEQYGSLSDLDETLVFLRSELELLPQDHPYRAPTLGNLAYYLHSRFRRRGTLPDLEEALPLIRNALGHFTQDHPYRVITMDYLAFFLHTRFEQFGMLSDLEEALTLARSVSELCPQGTSRGYSPASLSLYLHARFERLGTLSDLDEAIRFERSGLHFLRPWDSNRTTSLATLASLLYTRFQQLGSWRLTDLWEALAFERDVLDSHREGHPDHVRSLLALANYLHTQFKQSIICDTSRLERALDLYSQLSHVSQTLSFAELQQSKSWIQAAEEWKHPTTVLAYQTFLRFVVHYLATRPSLLQHLTLLKQMITSTVVDAFSACVRYDSPTNAVELLEQGRGVFWCQSICLRSPLDDVIASGAAAKKFADKFIQFGSALRMVLDVPRYAKLENERASHLNTQLQDVINGIRQLPGLSRLLHPPPFSDLQIAASGGPVIIVNASRYSCDALIVLPDRDPIRVALSITKARVFDLSSDFHLLMSGARVRDVTKQLSACLRELWYEVVFPITDVLQQFCPRGSRIWWCPTTEFSLLPLHAACSFRKGQPKLSDLYIPSYTSTLALLVRTRQKRESDPSNEWQRFLAVGQAQAHGQRDFIAFNDELCTISHRIGTVATLTCIQDQDVTIDNVARELKRNEFIHLGCDGDPGRVYPFESGFVLGDGLYKVEDIIRSDLQSVQFAYLSACQAITVGGGESLDENAHLTSAMQFAGVRSVVGTMYSVGDAYASEIASRFYEHMLDESGRLDGTLAALALHQTMHGPGSSEIPLDQRISYIHVGV